MAENENGEPIDIRFNEFPNVGFITAKLPDSIFSLLKDEVKKMQLDLENNTQYQSTLAGHITHAYQIVDTVPLLAPFVEHLVDIFNDRWNYKDTAIMSPLETFQTELSSCWVNFQQKYEFNPPHVHRGLMSFVIWVQIPYDLEQESAQFPLTAEQKASKFQFHYTTSLGDIRTVTLNVDKSMEGVICLFPAAMMHSVNPFYTSDDYRISVSGNIGFKAPK
tara:strand:+ start:22393 stop:23052 length:660 start_codon:yes stop_codon:yes gene_type:complete